MPTAAALPVHLIHRNATGQRRDRSSWEFILMSPYEWRYTMNGERHLRFSARQAMVDRAGVAPDRSPPRN
jgi:hypothetical protein